MTNESRFPVEEITLSMKWYAEQCLAGNRFALLLAGAHALGHLALHCPSMRGLYEQYAGALDQWQSGTSRCLDDAFRIPHRPGGQISIEWDLAERNGKTCFRGDLIIDDCLALSSEGKTRAEIFEAVSMQHGIGAKRVEQIYDAYKRALKRQPPNVPPLETR